MLTLTQTLRLVSLYEHYRIHQYLSKIPNRTVLYQRKNRFLLMCQPNVVLQEGMHQLVSRCSK